MGGLSMVVWCLWKQDVSLGFWDIIMILLAFAGGFLTYSGVFILTSGLAFFTVKGLDWINIFTNASYQVARCPVDLMPRILRNMFTFFMPMLVISYYPASAVCGWGESRWKGFLALPAQRNAQATGTQTCGTMPQAQIIRQNAGLSAPA
jgi:ABC-2 type transport system permease protein